jgi:hypothetical protein
LLARRHSFHGARVPPVIESQETVTQLAENLAVNALIQVGANFKITRHRNSRHLACGRRGITEQDGEEGLQPKECRFGRVVILAPIFYIDRCCDK